jgi:hypothetical protein
MPRICKFASSKLITDMLIYSIITNVILIIVVIVIHVMVIFFGNVIDYDLQ